MLRVGGLAGTRGGKRKAKSFPNKTLADHFAKLKYTQLNSDVFTGTVNMEWRQMAEAYELSKHVAGFRDTSIYEAMLTLKHFERIAGPCASKQIIQTVLDKFILERGKEVKRYTRIKTSRIFEHSSVGDRRSGISIRTCASRRLRSRIVIHVPSARIRSKCCSCQPVNDPSVGVCGCSCCS